MSTGILDLKPKKENIMEALKEILSASIYHSQRWRFDKMSYGLQ